MSDRTIRRDFELIRELFGDFMSKEGECYRAYEKVLLDDVLHATDLMTLANIVNLFGVTDKHSLISEQTKALIDKSMSVYDFKSRPFESMQNIDVVKRLEQAIITAPNAPPPRPVMSLTRSSFSMKTSTLLESTVPNILLSFAGSP